jgi:hypothetical protein
MPTDLQKPRSATSHHKPNWLGKPAAEMRADAATWRDQEPVTESCLFCDWNYTGLVADGRQAAKTHRTKHHPEADRPQRPTANPAATRSGPSDDQVIEENRRARLAREEAERLATIERGRIRREQAA